MRENWTDDRMDDLNGKVDGLRLETKTEFGALRGEMKTEFKAVRSEMKEEFGALREEMRAGFKRVDERFEKVDERFEKVDERFEKFEIRSDERFEAMMDRLYSMQRLMLQFCGAAIVTLIGFLATRV